nr:MAG TPA: hypothetical protein [Caudoviricetes sp.]
MVKVSRGTVRQVRRVPVRSNVASQGMACSVVAGEARLGRVRNGEVRSGRHGTVGSVRRVLDRRGKVLSRQAWFGLALQGKVRFVGVRHGRRGMVSRDMACCGWIWYGRRGCSGVLSRGAVGQGTVI